jgi:hypothetical protein
MALSRQPWKEHDMDWKSLATLRPAHSFGFANGGWTLDAYPDLETLDAHSRMTVGTFEGPGVVTCFHCTHHSVHAPGVPETNRAALVARGIVLEVYYNDEPIPGVCVPLADFFADGCAGRAEFFSTPFVEKAPYSYNCYLPMPFARSIRVMLRNDTDYDFMNYSYLEMQRLPAWDESLGYLHATWRRFPFQLTRESNHTFFEVEGKGHLIGRNWSIATDEPLFRSFHFVMEANNEVRVDGAKAPTADYLGSEDSFGFAWSWPALFTGLRNGINVLQNEDPTLLSTYRFHTTNAIPFERRLEWRVNWEYEFQNNAAFHGVNLARRDAGGAWLDYATTHYWYQQAVGYPHVDMPPLDDRMRQVLHANPL